MSAGYSREAELGTRWISVVFGWLSALGASLILSGIVGALVAAIFAAPGLAGGIEGGISGLVGLSLTLLLAISRRGLVTPQGVWRVVPGPSTARWWRFWPLS
jgi:hypothetical protein